MPTLLIDQSATGASLVALFLTLSACGGRVSYASADDGGAATDVALDTPGAKGDSPLDMCPATLPALGSTCDEWTRPCFSPNSCGTLDSAWCDQDRMVWNIDRACVQPCPPEAPADRSPCTTPFDVCVYEACGLARSAECRDGVWSIGDATCHEDCPSERPESRSPCARPGTRCYYRVSQACTAMALCSEERVWAFFAPGCAGGELGPVAR